MEKSFICINCPRGCRLKVDVNGENITVTGYKCKRGLDYAKQEAIHPVRTLTSTVLVEGNARPLPVKTSKPIPKELLFEAMKQISAVRIKPPVKIGDAIIKDILNTGADIIATDNY